MVGKALCAAIIIALVPSSSHAQQSSPSTVTDAQRRKAHLPFVRATTDCISKTVLRQTDIVQKVQQNQLQSAISNVGSACSQEVQMLIQKHDEIYGYGTGQSFFSGPYLNDLPRAVLSRIRPEIDRRATELARWETQRKELLDFAETRHSVARQTAYDCTREQLATLVKSSEAAAVLTQAAMSVCRKEINAMIDASSDWEVLKTGSHHSPTVKNEIREVIGKSVMTQAVQARAEMASQVQPQVIPQPLPVPQLQPKATPSQPQNASNIGSVLACLQRISTLRDGRMIVRDKLLETMIDLCRPEIEADARDKFLESKDGNIQDARKQAASAALVQARQILGIVDAGTPKTD